MLPFSIFFDNIVFKIITLLLLIFGGTKFLENEIKGTNFVRHNSREFEVKTSREE